MQLLAETTEGELTGHKYQMSEDILNRLKRYGILSAEADLDNILALDTKSFLDRRLQTQVYRQGFANSLKQARQFITHGHITVGDKKITIPSYLVTKDEELTIGYYVNSPMQKENHPERPVEIVKREIQQIKEVQDDRRRGKRRGRR